MKYLGFYRTRQRAMEIFEYEKKPKNQAGGADAAWAATVMVVRQLEIMLLPLWKQGGKSYDAAAWNKGGKYGMGGYLNRIVSLASSVSRAMCREPDVVYYWQPTFKDEEFEPGRMECYNLKEMISTSPYDRKTINGIDRAILRKDHGDRSEAIVRIVCFPGLVAYRQHGGALAQKELGEEAERRGDHEAVPPDVRAQRKRLAAHEDTLTGDEGFRTRIVGKSVVLLEWGKQRLLTKEAGTSVHIDAMNKQNGKSMDRYHDHDDYAELWTVYQKVQEGVSVADQEEEWSRRKKRSGSWGGWRPF